MGRGRGEGGISSVVEREVPCYLRDLLTSDGSDLHPGTWRLLEIFTHFFSGRTQSSH